MTIWTTISILLALLYCALIAVYVYGWHCLKKWQAKSKESPKTTVCVIIPARNEAANIEKCVRAILAQNYPQNLLEIIVVDDHSTDNTAAIVEKITTQYPNLKLIQLAKVLAANDTTIAFKKLAIHTAISSTEQELIVTTDADCWMEQNWLQTLVAFYEEKEAKLIAAPVCFSGETTFFQRFQSLDFVGMIVATGASIQLDISNMCNGANLAYTRAAFWEVDGFKGIDDIASGDDMLLMTKIANRYPRGIHFLKNNKATVFTLPQPDFKSFVQQRLRWASKSAKYEDWRITVFLAAVYFFNISIPFNFLAGILWNTTFLKIFAVQLFLKSLSDFVFLGSGCLFFKRKDLLWLFLPAQIMHILYIIGIGTAGNFGTYEWKGRQVK